MEQDRLRELLVEHLIAGSLATPRLLAVLRELSLADPIDAASLPELLAALDDPQAPAGIKGQTLEALQREVLGALIESAQQVHALRAGNRPIQTDLLQSLSGLDLELPQPWPGRISCLHPLHALLVTLRDRHALDQKWPELQELRDLVEERYQTLLAEAREWDVPWHSFGLSDTAEQEALRQLEQEFDTAVDRDAQQRALDRALAWTSDAVCPVLSGMCTEPWAARRACVSLSLRFGQPQNKDWEAWRRWLSSWERNLVFAVQKLGGIEQSHAAELAFLRQQLAPGSVPSSAEDLEAACREVAEAVDPADLARRYRLQLDPQERRALVGGAVPPPLPEPAPTSAPITPPETGTPTPTPPPEKPAWMTAGPTIWKDHLRPFFLDNWYIVAGILMLVVGSSLVAYFTWERHWLIRYTILPAMLGGFTAGLAWLGNWLERKDAQFRDTSAILRGAAIGLLPVNFMTVAFLGDDPAIAEYRGTVVLLVALLYLGLFGVGLRKWCRAVHPALTTLLGGTLLFLNGLVALRPVAEALGGENTPHLATILGTGFHLGFAVLAASVIRFTRQTLTRDMAGDRRVLWFFGATLVLTFLQVFAWVHASFGRLPQVYTYAPMLILTGGLVLYVERRAQQLREQEPSHGGESFLGFALILLGVLMGQAQESMRIGCLVLAGCVWLFEAGARRHPAHNWIGVMLLALGVGAVGLLDGFDRTWLPTLGLGLALGLDGVRLALGSQKPERAGLRQAAAGVRFATLFFTVVIAVLVQWHFRSDPRFTAAHLLVIAGYFLLRAHREQQLHWWHTAMVVLAVTLPYLGCVDMRGRSLHGNTMVFGLSVLSILWLSFNAWTPTRLSRLARSSVLWTYGALAVAGMALRVLPEQQTTTPGDLLWYRVTMDYAGPLMMAGCLVFATWFSRSLIPAGMAAIIVIILFPELRNRYADVFEQMGWGTGLGSAVSAVLLTLACFVLRRVKALQGLSEGDRFLDRMTFPWQRRDHTLFTWPLLASVLFLTVKVDTFTLVKNLNGDVGNKTAAAVLLTAVVWHLLAAYRQVLFAPAMVHFGWITLCVSMVVFDVIHADQPSWIWPCFHTGLLLTLLYLAYRFLLERRWPWVKKVFTGPTRAVLEFASAGLGILSVMAMLADGKDDDLLVLLSLLVLHHAWHGVRRFAALHGTLLFVVPLVALLAWQVPGNGALLPRLTLEHATWPLLGYALGAQALLLLAEPFQTLRARTHPLRQALQVAVVVLAVGMAGAVTVDYLSTEHVLGVGQELALLALVLLAARSAGSGGMALLSFLVGYIAVHGAVLGAESSRQQRLDELLSPWHLAMVAFALPVGLALGRLLHLFRPWLIQGPEPLLKSVAPVSRWLLVPAVLLAWMAALEHTVIPGMRELRVQLWTPYLGAATALLAGLLTRRGSLFVHGGLLLTLGNVHFVRVMFGDYLLGRHLSHVHLVCLGLVASLLMTFAARWLLQGFRTARTGLDQASIGIAGLVLVLLAGNYVVHPDLMEVSHLRFVLSGAMAYLAGIAFRQVARQAEDSASRTVDLLQGAYHFGVTLALWCAALLIPALRHPNVALIALSVPVFYFALRAELSFRHGLVSVRRYRLSAAAVGFGVIGLYAARDLFHMILFPNSPIETGHYHVNAVTVLLVGLVLLRLHALGGTWWLAFYGGLSVMVGSYFGLTWFPALSPFQHVVPAAWCAIALTHFWTVATDQRSPLRAGIQLLAGCTDEEWTTLRRSWGWFLLAASHAAVLVAVLDPDTVERGLAIAPLLLGAASVLVHHGVLRRSSPPMILAGVEVLIALHADFLVHSYLDRDFVAWAILAAWAALLVAHATFEQRRQLGRMDTLLAGLTCITVLHVLFLGPDTSRGLWVMTCIGVLGALTPLSRSLHQRDYLAGALLLAVPTWLAYFSQFPAGAPDWSLLQPLAPNAWPPLAAAAMLLLTGQAAAHLAKRPLPALVASASRPRLYQQVLAWLCESGARIHLALLVAASLLVMLIQGWHYSQALEIRELVLMCLLYASLAVLWCQEGRRRASMIGYLAAKVSVVMLFVAIRRHLTLTTDFWRLEYDVWVSLLASFLLVGARQLFDLRPKERQVPFALSILTLPAFSLAWTLFHGLGSDVALLVIGVHSLMFSFLGKDDRESPYHMAAIAGFVAFVMITFWAKLELRVLHAYVIPVGLGILVLLQLFRQRVAPAVRNQIRLVTVLSMLGSAGWYALVDVRYPVTFHVTLLILCLLAMGLGSLLRIRLYLVLGFAGVLVTLGSILYRAFSGMERATRMTSVGVLVLLLGASLVMGAIYYKTHREAIHPRLERWRRRFGEWD